MKKVLIVAAILLAIGAAGVMVAASGSGLDSRSIVGSSNKRINGIWKCYVGTGDNDWDCFEICLYTDWNFEGTWYEGTDTGTIEGFTISPGTDSCKAIGYYMDDQDDTVGTWSGTFGIRVDTCYGITIYDGHNGGDPSGAFHGNWY